MLPRITWAGIEARSYAPAAAAWLTVLLVAAVRRTGRALGAVYALALVASTALNVFLVLMMLVHAVAVLAIAGRRPAAARWAVAATVSLVAVAPFLAFCRGQISQVGWISGLGGHIVAEIVKQQYFDDSVAFAALAAVVLAAPLVSRRVRVSLGGDRRLLVLAAAWITVPTGVLLGYSAAFEPVYHRATCASPRRRWRWPSPRWWSRWPGRGNAWPRC